LSCPNEGHPKSFKCEKSSQTKMNRLKGKVALITGSATGIGKSTAILFGKEGAKVVVTTDRNLKGGREVAEEINKAGGEAIFIRLDVTQEDSWRKGTDLAVKEFGKLNILVNNAGVSLCKDVEQTSLDEWNWVMRVNSTGVFLGTKYGISAMKKNGEPCSIINISSIDGIVGEAGLAAYCASKGAVRLLTKSAALHCAEKGYSIRVNSIHPAYVQTELTDKEAMDSGLTPEQYLGKVCKMHPIGRVGKPTEISYLEFYLASDESCWTTGAEFVVDGGYAAQ
jgi:NAD(P)-dependent dehydrogenase (short-subunit alcohol dehydrogenase family)